MRMHIKAILKQGMSLREKQIQTTFSSNHRKDKKNHVATSRFAFLIDVTLSVKRHVSCKKKKTHGSLCV